LESSGRSRSSPSAAPSAASKPFSTFIFSTTAGNRRGAGIQHLRQRLRLGFQPVQRRLGLLQGGLAGVFRLARGGDILFGLGGGRSACRAAFSAASSSSRFPPDRRAT
jgi:hypothetical protein